MNAIVFILIVFFYVVIASCLLGRWLKSREANPLEEGQDETDTFLGY